MNLSPKGTGVLYCRKGMDEKLWCHTASGSWDNRKLGCERLTNIGTANYSLLVGLAAAIEFQEKLGKQQVADRGRYLNTYLRTRLRAIGSTWFMNGPPPDLSTSIVKVVLPVKKIGDFPARMWQEHRIWLMAGEGDDKLGPTIRFSLPLYVRVRDIDRTLGLLKTELLREA